ncbi:hypothetical protein DMUE_0092 [Dictyocoela muelleri]|nr:hypothetical protein DMUE_0092 [Dictyocoela muelleri]
MQKNLRDLKSEDSKISINNNDNKNDNNKNNRNNTIGKTIYNNIKNFYNNFDLPDKISIIDSNGCCVSSHLEISHNTKKYLIIAVMLFIIVRYLVIQIVVKPYISGFLNIRQI